MPHIGQNVRGGYQIAALTPKGKPSAYLDPLTGETISARQYRNRTEAQAAGFESISQKQRERSELGFTYIRDFQSVIGPEKEVWRIYSGKTIAGAYRFAQETKTGDVMTIVAFAKSKGKKKGSDPIHAKWVTIQNAQTQRLYNRMSDEQIDAIAAQYSDVSEVNVWVLAI